MQIETSTCRRCGRKLTASAAAGIGPVCSRRERAEQEFKAPQVAKAVELVQDGGIRRARPRSRVFLAVSTDGATTYRVGPRGCTCPHGRKAAGKGEIAHCYHRAARTLVTAA